MTWRALALFVLAAGCTEQVPACGGSGELLDGTRCVPRSGDAGLDAGGVRLDAGPEPLTDAGPGADAGTDAGCPAGELACGGACVDVSSSPAHCGVCDRACGAGMLCRSGECREDPVEVSAAPLHTCARLASGQVFCWGDNRNGQLGDGTIEQRLEPVAVEGVTNATSISAAGAATPTTSSTCAARNDGTVACWGHNHRGQLGDGTTEQRLEGVQVVGLTSARRVGVGWSYACATRDADPYLSCWGRPPYVLSSLPTGLFAVAGWSATGIPLDLATGALHACVVAPNRVVYCWGQNTHGQLGDGTFDPREIAVAVTGLTDVAQVAVTASSTCALRSGGEVWCWGRGDRLGLGETAMNANRPQRVVELPAAQRIFGGQHAEAMCATSMEGEVRCWGVDFAASVRDSMNVTAHLPTVVPGVAGASQLSVAAGHACALVDHEVLCWGSNTAGQLGDGSMTASATPVVVGLP